MRVPFDTQPFVGPSGRTLAYGDLVLLAELHAIGMIAWSAKEIPFHQGFLSHIYVQGRNDLSDQPSTLRRLCAHMKVAVEELPHSHGPQKCVIGIPTAATQLAQGVSMLSELEQVAHVADSRKPPISFRSLRQKLKGHGKDKRWIDPPDLVRHSYVTIENVISTASGMLEHLDHLNVEGYPIYDMHHVVFADWELGGIENLTTNGFENVHRLYIMRDIISMYVHLGLWPQEYYDEHMRRYAAWQQSARAA